MCMLEFLWLDVAREMEGGGDTQLKRPSRFAVSPFSSAFKVIAIWGERRTERAKRQIGGLFSGLGRAAGHGWLGRATAVARVAGVIVERKKQA